MLIYEAMAGETVHRAAEMMSEMASNAQEDVTCEFNGTTLLARPGNHPDDIADQLWAENRRREQAKRQSSIDEAARAQRSFIKLYDKARLHPYPFIESEWAELRSYLPKVEA